MSGIHVRDCLRPKNRSRDVNVPCSASNRSSNGVRAITFSMACTKPMCISGKVFVRYTACASRQIPYSELGRIIDSKIRTRAEANLLGFQCPPFLQVPEGRYTSDPKKSNKGYHETRE
jgi:hypothetical protein